MSIDKELNEYAAKSGRSRVLHEEALAVMPGGNSRTTTFFDPYPFAIQRGQGAHLWDADGIDRLDFNGNYTSLILGHAPPDVVKAVQQAVELGLSFPGPTEHEVRLAELLTRRVPSVQAIRFTNSGTEATMNAVRLARAFTGRAKIAKFEGAYHGTHDWVMVSVSGDAKSTGSRRRPKPVAWSAGIPPAVLKHVVVLPWNDAEGCAEILEAEAGQLACLIVDPMMCNAGLVPPADGFLARLREITERHGIVLIFDEVISFRTAWGGAQERFGIRPDLTTFGKIIGGGLPVGAFGGRRDIMDFYDPRKGGARISHGGTFNANPVTMAAGLATMNALTPDAYVRLDALGERLRGGVARLLAATRRRGQVTGVGSLFWLHWTSEALTDYRSARPKDGETAVRVFLGLLNEGILLTQRGLGACSLPMTDEDVDRFINALARVLAREDKEPTMANKFIDLNADMGESWGRWTLGADEEIMPYLTSANVACGFHAGDPHVMRKTVALALRHGVAIGSHPSLPDLMGFGRRVMDVSPQELKDYLCYQTGALREFVRASGGELQHTKPHGILYSMIEKDEALATAVAESARESGKDLILMALGSGKYDRTARKMGVRVASEGFADRAYNVDLTLVSRKLPNSLITDPERAAAQAVKMAMESKVRTIDGVEIDISVQTICCHGDTPGAQKIVRAVREALDRAGCQVKPLRDFLPKA